MILLVISLLQNLFLFLFLANSLPFKAIECYIFVRNILQAQEFFEIFDFEFAKSIIVVVLSIPAIFASIFALALSIFVLKSTNAETKAFLRFVCGIVLILTFMTDIILINCVL